jgi:Tfp pilus assembly protein PilO
MKRNVKILSIEPKEIIQEDIYLKIPAEIRLRGTYNQIVNYIEDVKYLNYLTRIENLNVKTSNKADYLEAKITLLSYALDRKGDIQ